MGDTGKVDITNRKANMFGCLPCPKCKSELRVPLIDGTVTCDNCGFSEPITNDVAPSEPGA